MTYSKEGLRESEEREGGTSDEAEILSCDEVKGMGWDVDGTEISCVSDEAEIFSCDEVKGMSWDRDGTAISCVDCSSSSLLSDPASANMSADIFKIIFERKYFWNLKRNIFKDENCTIL